MNVEKVKKTGRNGENELTLLVVEDNPANMNYLLFLLKKMNLAAVKAATGEEALILMKNKTVDGALLDINLGHGMSGIELMQILRREKRFAKIPIIAVTAYYGGGLHEELLEQGFTDYLCKPFKYNELKEMLAKYFIIH